MDSPRRSAAPVVMVAGLAGVLAWLLIRVRGAGPAASGGSSSAERPTTPVGRVGEEGPQWKVVESLLIARPAGEIAQHLHDHGGLPGLSGGLDGPVMDRIEWDVEGTGHYEAEVHGLPGVNHTRVTVRVAPRHGGSRGAAESLAAGLSLVGGGSERARVSRSLSRLQRLLQSTQPGSPERAAGASSDAGQELRRR